MFEMKNANIQILDLLLSNMEKKPSIYLDKLHETNLNKSFFEVIFKHYPLSKLSIFEEEG